MSWSEAADSEQPIEYKYPGGTLRAARAFSLRTPEGTKVMTNPDVTQNEEITAWEWLAGAAILVVLFGSLALHRNRQLTSNDTEIAPPPITRSLEAPELPVPLTLPSHLL
jgi:hypothetical protein